MGEQDVNFLGDVWQFTAGVTEKGESHPIWFSFDWLYADNGEPGCLDLRTTRLGALKVAWRLFCAALARR